ncbi:MAG: thermonuclease family protein [Saprospiraceae bacterium]|nr:thermonuclease family protein [Saprospiraceae bacterium]
MRGTYHKVINGDSRNMSELRDESIHLVVTSPPYWQLKDYGTENQIGFHDDYETYINHLNLTWQECFRVLHKGCRLCVNIGDQFARAVYYGRYKVIPIRTEIIKFCETIGFDYMGAVIWQKVGTTNTTGGASIMGSFPYPRNGILKIDYEFILIFKKPGDAPRPTEEQKERSKMTTEEWNEYFSGHWNFSGVRQENHLAMFPEELPRRLIRMFSFVGENVLDPFLGSGTSMLAAKNLGRNSCGFEINPAFIPIIKQKLGVEDNLLFKDFRVDFVAQAPLQMDFDKAISQLPYIFTDTHRLDKKIDVKKLQFGSRLDANGNGHREEFFSVKEILSPELVRLNNGLTVRLIGVKEDPHKEKSACDFLLNKTKGKRVFMKFDATKYDLENNLMAYLYLENKTFLNAHLIKKGLALVDNTVDFRYRKKFNDLAHA